MLLVSVLLLAGLSSVRLIIAEQKKLYPLLTFFCQPQLYIREIILKLLLLFCGFFFLTVKTIFHSLQYLILSHLYNAIVPRTLHEQYLKPVPRTCASVKTTTSTCAVKLCLYITVFTGGIMSHTVRIGSLS